MAIAGRPGLVRWQPTATRCEQLPATRSFLLRLGDPVRGHGHGPVYARAQATLSLVSETRGATVSTSETAVAVISSNSLRAPKSLNNDPLLHWSEFLAQNGRDARGCSRGACPQ